MTLEVKVSPATNELTLTREQTASAQVQITVPKSATPLGPVDVYFLADTTGSMGPVLAAVQEDATRILGELQSLPNDMHFGVGNYRDFPANPYAFQHQQSLTADLSSVSAAIANWKTSGGGDTPEGQLYALDQLAVPPGGSIGWRPQAKRLLVWFGDAPGHDPICQAMSGLSYDITEAFVTKKLVDERISVLAISMTSKDGPKDGLNDDPTVAKDYQEKCGPAGGASGQATRIAQATGGVCLNGVDASAIVQTILEQVKAQVSSISNLRLVATGDIEPFVSAISPSEGYGPLAADQKHVLSFDVSFTGMRPPEASPQILSGTLDVVADSVVVGHQNVKVTVPSTSPGHIEFQVSPATNELTLVGQQMARAQVQITVTKPAVAQQADIYFLADTTESMRPILTTVQEGVTRTLSDLKSLPTDMHFGVGNYKDFPAQPSEAFKPQQSLAAQTSRPDDPVTAAITSWKTGGGGDTPEGQLYALDQLAVSPGSSIGWRPQAKRFVVWFGDAPGHDPICQAMSGLSYDITEASVTKKLVDEQISVLAVSMNTEHGPKDGLNANPIEGLDSQGKGYWAVDYGEECPAGGTAGQATRIAQATGGACLDGINASAIVKTISDQVKAQVGNVRLVARGGIEPFVRAISPKKGYGPLTADKEHILSFDVYFAGVRSPDTSPQVLIGTLDIVADDVVVGHQNVTITVPAGK